MFKDIDSTIIAAWIGLAGVIIGIIWNAIRERKNMASGFQQFNKKLSHDKKISDDELMLRVHSLATNIVTNQSDQYETLLKELKETKEELAHRDAELNKLSKKVEDMRNAMEEMRDNMRSLTIYKQKYEDLLEHVAKNLTIAAETPKG